MIEKPMPIRSRPVATVHRMSKPVKGSVVFALFAAVVCLLALEHQFLPANINFRNGEEDIDLNIVANETRAAPLRTALSNSFGFGGTNASILVRKVDV